MSARVVAQTPVPSKSEDAEGQLAYAIYPKGGSMGEYFQPKIDPGASEQLTVVLANTGTVDFKAHTYAVNAHTRVNGGFEADEAGAQPVGPTEWLNYPEKHYTIKPHTAVERTFTVKVPKGTEPGQYLTALVLANEPSPIKGSSDFNQVVRFTLPVFITVPGPVNPEFKIGQINLVSAEKYSQLEIQIANTGNVRVRPSGTVTVSEGHGGNLFSAPVSMGSVFAHDSTSLEIPLPPVAQGDYQVAVDLYDPETKAVASGKATVTATAPATPPPPPPVQLQNATATPMPDAKHIQFLDVKATISNSGEALTNVKVVLHAVKDGKPVEDFALNSSLSVPNGETSIESRYLPATGWTSGEWSFTLSVEAVTGGSGVAQVLATTDLGSVTIP